MFGQYYFSSGMQNNTKSSYSRSRGMTREEALNILGLKEGTEKETILRAHRDLLKKIHPDHGGSNYLAVMINEARKVLLDE